MEDSGGLDKSPEGLGVVFLVVNSSSSSNNQLKVHLEEDFLASSNLNNLHLADLRLEEDLAVAQHSVETHLSADPLLEEEQAAVGFNLNNSNNNLNNFSNCPSMKKIN